MVVVVEITRMKTVEVLGVVDMVLVEKPVVHMVEEYERNFAKVTFKCTTAKSGGILLINAILETKE